MILNVFLDHFIVVHFLRSNPCDWYVDVIRYAWPGLRPAFLPLRKEVPSLKAGSSGHLKTEDHGLIVGKCW